MKLSEEIRWVNETDCGPALEIVDFQMKEKDKILVLRNGVELIQMSIFGKNFNFLFNTLGPDSDMWLHKNIRLRQDINAKGKAVRTILNAV